MSATEELEHVLVVGAGLAGAQACEQLRRQGFTGRITLIGAEEVPPYDRPPLTKDVLAGTRDDTTLRTDFAALDVTLRLGVRATELRVAERVVVTDAGGRERQEIPYDGLVVATGADPVRLPGSGPQAVVRTLADARWLRERLRPGSTVALVGASWIGAEVATAALAAGCAVTCVEAGPSPLSAALGREVGSWTVPWWRDVDLHLDTSVRSVEPGGIVLGNGTTLSADLVVTGVGARSSVGWLEGSGLPLDRGLVVDEWLRAAPGIVAVGDVAVWRSRRWDRHLRVEHWDDAADAPAVAVAALLNPGLAGVRPHDPVPYFWSDQFGHKLQYVGHHGPDDRLVRRAGDDADRWTALWVDGEGTLTAAVACDRPRDLRDARLLLTQGASVDVDRVGDAAEPLRAPAARV